MTISASECPEEVSKKIKKESSLETTSLVFTHINEGSINKSYVLYGSGILVKKLSGMLLQW
jgi:hypothetical protein